MGIAECIIIVFGSTILSLGTLKYLVKVTIDITNSVFYQELIIISYCLKSTFFYLRKKKPISIQTCYLLKKLYYQQCPQITPIEIDPEYKFLAFSAWHMLDRYFRGSNGLKLKEV